MEITQKTNSIANRQFGHSVKRRDACAFFHLIRLLQFVAVLSVVQNKFNCSIIKRNTIQASN